MYVSWFALAVALVSIWYAASQGSEAVKAARDVERRLIEVQDQLRIWSEVLPHPDRGRVSTDDDVRSAEQFLDHELLAVERSLEARIAAGEQSLDAKLDKLLREVADGSYFIARDFGRLEDAAARLETAVSELGSGRLHDANES